MVFALGLAAHGFCSWASCLLICIGPALPHLRLERLRRDLPARENTDCQRTRGTSNLDSHAAPKILMGATKHRNALTQHMLAKWTTDNVCTS